MFRLLLLLFAGHALCDFPLQGDFLSRGKQSQSPLPGIPWGWCLLAHALIHAGMVYLITGSLVLGFAELVVHAFIDWAKCEGWFSFSTDQYIHYAFKLLWAMILVTWPRV